MVLALNQAAMDLGWNWSTSNGRSDGSVNAGTLEPSKAYTGSYSYKQNGTAIGFLNGANKTVANDTANPISHSGNNVKYIGVHPDLIPNTFWNGEIAELMVFDQQLSDEQLSEINAHLANKWGLTTTVDSDGDGTVDADDSDTPTASTIDSSPRWLGRHRQ